MNQIKKCIVGGELFELTEVILTSYIIGQLTLLDHYESFARCPYGKELVQKAENTLQKVLDSIIHSDVILSEQKCEEMMSYTYRTTREVIDFIELEVVN